MDFEAVGEVREGIRQDWLSGRIPVEQYAAFDSAALDWQAKLADEALVAAFAGAELPLSAQDKYGRFGKRTMSVAEFIEKEPKGVAL